MEPVKESKLLKEVSKLEIMQGFVAKVTNEDVPKHVYMAKSQHSRYEQAEEEAQGFL